jgi:hypothetical protein
MRKSLSCCCLGAMEFFGDLVEFVDRLEASRVTMVDE